MGMRAIHHKILAMDVALTSYRDTGTRVLKAAREQTAYYVCVANVHMCMEVFDDSDFSKIVNNANLVVPDGVPLVWGLKALGFAAEQVRGSDLLLHLCREAEKERLSIGLYGGTEESLSDFKKFLKREFPSINISFAVSPPFRELSIREKEQYDQQIKDSDCRILFVGIGCPKQEKWMAEHKDKLSCVMVGVGAAFDFFSGRKKHAPRWMQKCGLEWLFRLASDPRRLWKRYLKHNPRFIYHFGKQYLQYRFGEKQQTKEHG
jgi:N-acetylglucosaminyldiphosphoundecaprenol N-acetyl-beta-D-mannosaminyltransferase